MTGKSSIIDIYNAMPIGSRLDSCYVEGTTGSYPYSYCRIDTSQKVSDSSGMLVWCYSYHSSSPELWYNIINTNKIATGWIKVSNNLSNNTLSILLNNHGIITQYYRIDTKVYLHVTGAYTGGNIAAWNESLSLGLLESNCRPSVVKANVVNFYAIPNLRIKVLTDGNVHFVNNSGAALDISSKTMQGIFVFDVAN